MKAIDLITRSMVTAGALGAGESLAAADATTGLQLANDMLDSWSLSRLYVYQLLEESFPLTIGDPTYMIGPGGDFNTTRPVSIDSVYVRVNNIDYPIELIDNNAYSGISLKSSITGYPQYLYYDPQAPLGEINIWPAPAQTMSLFLQTPRQLTQFPDLTTDIVFPPGYSEAIHYNLAVRICADYQLPVPKIVMDLAQSAKERLQTANSTVPVLAPDFKARGSGRFNVYKG